MPAQLRSSHVAFVFSLMATSACGPAPLDASEGESESSDASTADASTADPDTGTEESDTGMEESETIEPSPCDACADDQLCVGLPWSDACGLGFGYDVECRDSDPSCEDALCSDTCLDAVCGANFQCVPACSFVEGVELWCDPSATDSTCDPLSQDCPEGEKCVPYASTGNAWDANKCVPVTGDRAVGEPCTYGGSVEATDDCDATSWCFGTDLENMGTCASMCGLDHACQEDHSCFVANEGSINVCLADCLPLLPNTCAEGELCRWWSDTFSCLPTGETLEPDAECTFTTPCGAGQFCVSAAVIEGCAGEGCCTDYCDLSQPDPCMAPESCRELGAAEEPEFADIGGCLLPSP